MTCTHIETAKLKPGRMNELLALTEQARPTIERSGGKHFRLYRVTVGGPNTGLLYWAIDFDDMAAWGSAIDQLGADADWGQHLERVWGADGAVTREGASLLQEDGRYGATDRPSQAGVSVEVAFFQLNPGRLEDARRFTAAAAEHFKPLGGHCRVFQQVIAGESSGLYAVATEFPNMAALGAWRGKVASDPNIHAIMADWFANPPATRLNLAVSTRLM